MHSHVTKYDPAVADGATSAASRLTPPRTNTGQRSHSGANRPDGNSRKNNPKAAQLNESRNRASGRIPAGKRAGSISHVVPNSTRKYAVTLASGCDQPRQTTMPAAPNQTTALSMASTRPNQAYVVALKPSFPSAAARVSGVHLLGTSAVSFETPLNRNAESTRTAAAHSSANGVHAIRSARSSVNRALARAESWPAGERARMVADVSALAPSPPESGSTRARSSCAR